jgi:ectoine hydroxylase-related dioxygenase (phytanoyl-CoA dioxygenase family)
MTIKKFSGDIWSGVDDLDLVLQRDGVVVIESFIQPDVVERTKDGILQSLMAVRKDIGSDRLLAAGELGVVRAPMKQSPELLSLLHDDCLRRLAVALLGKGAICHLMNGLVLEPFTSNIRHVFQGKFHRDFPRYLNGYRASINTFLCLDDFSVANGSTRFIVGSHQSETVPDSSEEIGAQSVEGCAGALIVFDSTIWHAAGENTTTGSRVGINIQWTKAFIKQQIDLVRYLGPDYCERLDESVQASLGMHSRVVTSLEEYYLPSESRLYRAGQG